MTQRTFPPGLNHISVPLNSRASALAGIALYSACRRGPLLAQNAIWWGVRILGAWALPGRKTAPDPPIAPEAWSALSSEWRTHLGNFDTAVVHSRQQSTRSGFGALLMSGDNTLGFIKVQRTDESRLGTEEHALRMVEQAAPRSFRVPRVLASGAAGGWSYMAIEALPAIPHRPAKNPPLTEIIDEIQAALGGLNKDEDVPDYWRPVHGDFTPWNLRAIPRRGLTLIDWEEAGWGPPGADEVFYRATESAFREPEPLSNGNQEAIRYWMDLFSERTGDQRERHRLGEPVRAALQRMENQSRPE